MEKILDIDIATIKSSKMEDPNFMVMLMEAGEILIHNEKYFNRHLPPMQNVIRQWCIKILSYCSQTTPIVILNRLIQTIGMKFEENELLTMLAICETKKLQLPLPFILDVAKHTKNYSILKKCYEHDTRVLDFFNVNPMPIEANKYGLLLTPFLDRVLEDGYIPICIIVPKNLNIDSYTKSYLETIGIKLGGIFCSTAENKCKDLHNTLIMPKYWNKNQISEAVNILLSCH